VLLLEGTGVECIIMYTLCMFGFVIRSENNIWLNHWRPTYFFRMESNSKCSVTLNTSVIQTKQRLETRIRTKDSALCGPYTQISRQHLHLSYWRLEVSQKTQGKWVAEILLIENRAFSPTFPDVIIVSTLLIIPVAAAKTERSLFSLHLTKDYYRSTLAQEWLSDLAVLSFVNSSSFHQYACICSYWSIYPVGEDTWNTKPDCDILSWALLNTL
jgi:hypothetical protein